jgi:hypothetical protein
MDRHQPFAIGLERDLIDARQERPGAKRPSREGGHGDVDRIAHPVSRSARRPDGFQVVTVVRTLEETIVLRREASSGSW